MVDIPPGVGVGFAKVLLRTLGRPAAAVLDNLITGPLERRDAEKRAQSEVALRVINVVGDKIVNAVGHLTPQQLAQLTESASHRNILKQSNLNKVVQLALEQLPKETVQEQSETVSDEFLDTFEPIAENKSTEYMQALFARILSGENSESGIIFFKGTACGRSIRQTYRRFVSASLLDGICTGSFDSQH